MSQTLHLAGWVQDSIVDGPGLRFTAFFQGCTHHCPGCHNPETWPLEGGTPLSPAMLMELAEKNPLCRGITLSGGEPFLQAGQAMEEFLTLAKSKGYEIACYTGYTWEELMAQGTPAQRRMLEFLDILIDGRFMQEQRTLELTFRGSRNQRILQVQESLAQGHPVEETATRWTGEPPAPNPSLHNW